MSEVDRSALIARIDEEIEKERQALAADVIRLVNIPSVKGEPQPGAPFGPGPRAVLDEMLAVGRRDGFFVRDYGVGVISLAMKEGMPDLGIWLHGDVMPAGSGWRFDPFHAVEYRGCIIGRGATDNKGQLAAIYRLLRIFRRLGVELRYNPAVYIGSDEEKGMHDLTGVPGREDARGFIHVCTPPRMSLVPDSGFPVGYGGKGSMNLIVAADRPLHGIQLTAGRDDDPGKAWAVTPRGTVTAESAPRHMSSPDPNGNMITFLMDRLLERKETAPEDRVILRFFRFLSLDVYGEELGLDKKGKTMTRLTLFPARLETVDGIPQMTLNVRYPQENTAEEITETIDAAAKRCGLCVRSAEVTRKPYLLDKDGPIVQLLKEIANGVTGENKEPYTLGGGTYAHWLPNAYVFGTDGNLIPDDFPKGHGGAHGLDEAVSLDRLQRAMRIYARALLALNDREF